MGTENHAEAWRLDLGANILSDGNVRFKVWAPFCSRIDAKIIRRGGNERIPLRQDDWGYFQAITDRASCGDRYAYVLDGRAERPDPVSRYLPQGVHGNTEIVSPEDFRWTDRNWRGVPLSEFIIYEMHAGTFTREGTFDSAIAKIPYLKQLGVTCLEIMPVAQFPGKRNWGYDGVGLFAVQNSYGGPAGLKRLVNACHRAGLAVCLDVVYNHFGPEGNYLQDFGPYFTKKYHTPWGSALNYDDAGSEGVREFIVSNALYWITEYHADALRLDAIHGIYDFSAKHILEEVQERAEREARVSGRSAVLIAESDLNDSRIIRPRARGGYQLAAQWSDDFHHSAHVLLTGERGGYYRDFASVGDLAKAMRSAFVYDGKYSPFRRRRHGNSTEGLSFEKFVVCVQNHDQVGNRAYGDRLSSLVSFEKQKLAAAVLMLSPYVPLIFMGQEYGELNPFQYFIDHSDTGLIEAVRKGRAAEFVSFGWKSVPDPKSRKTFDDSKLNWGLLGRKKHRHLHRLYADLIRLRRQSRFCSDFSRRDIGVSADDAGQWVRLDYGKNGRCRFRIFFSFSERTEWVPAEGLERVGRLMIDTEGLRYGGQCRKTSFREGRLALHPFECLMFRLPGKNGRRLKG